MWGLDDDGQTNGTPLPNIIETIVLKRPDRHILIMKTIENPSACITIFLGGLNFGGRHNTLHLAAGPLSTPTPDALNLKTK